METKFCKNSKCIVGEPQFLDDFSKNRSRPDGRNQWCKVCTNKNNVITNARFQPNGATYNSWREMKSRCNNPKATSYPTYGGIGITYCDRWEKFVNFLEDMGERPGGTTLDRIDPHGNYEPSNCRWADRKTQANNKRKKRAA